MPSRLVERVRGGDLVQDGALLRVLVEQLGGGRQQGTVGLLVGELLALVANDRALDAEPSDELCPFVGDEGRS
ncbi:hypothetical protein GCM10010381_24690 [Streptomyces xantholiticus]|nr:hypothetical protein GCM10010381_24690 [Streptomyces xantholiticus]